ncbi:Putative EH domain, EF-hand domain, UBA-like superfamily, EF-hand domain pair protein [Septoria linicola]|uniref:EH domain, EF-hand domain, UBA-like superfamily, EF-hand domain pair protein n=1 Tax=Septoria linicola TaxID=215465 RepID=A0A9Q9EJY6_9PEZI|nr:Putative EH domain, EF-hand domain, UBA-like superfamily, EF-hand domain pair protein [Septoria linicola]
MAESDHSILNLSPEEKRAFAFLFQQADKDQLGVVTGENAVNFFERTKVSPDVLGEIWQIADTENRGFLSKPGFCMVLRLIGHYQSGKQPSSELAFKAGPVPKFEGLQIPGVGAPPAAAPAAIQPQLSGSAPIRVPPLDPGKVQQYSGLFERSGAQNGLLDGGTAKSIFERAGLPNETLGRIWMLADRQQRGALDQTEFIVAMHLLTSMKTRSMAALPTTLPQGLVEAAARRTAPQSRQGTAPAPIPRQLTGQGVGPARAQSPLSRPPNYATPPTISAQTTGQPWLITPADKAKFDQFFATIDPAGRGIITGEQAVSFFSNSGLPEDSLAQIWDLSDIKSEGQLNKDEFAVAMYLIRQQRAPNAAPLPAFLPPALIPPSMRTQQQQPQSTAPAFDNAAQKPAMPKSAADDLFGLDEPSQPQAPALQPQGTGASATCDPFAGGSPAAPSSPARFQPQQTGPAGMFKPFIPSSAFGATLAQQNTGGSFGSSQGAATRAPPAPAANDDLLGDNDTHAAESSQITNETTELANMSNQIGNLRGQMEQTQTKKNTTQAELNQTSAQKRDLEVRLQQFRTQFEQEVRAVKQLEVQLATSRDSTKKLSQELALLEGNYQDLQSQHQSVSQQLQADQQENASLKQRLAQINGEVTRLKPEIEKLKLDARQQKGMVSINKKQLATSEGARDQFLSEKSRLEHEATEREEQARSQPIEPETAAAGSGFASPAALASPASTLSANNPFFRKPSNEGGEQRTISPQPTGSGPTPSAFDALFGPPGAFASQGQAGSRSGTPPATSFVARALPAAGVAVAGAAVGAAAGAGMSDSVQSVSSVGQHTPAVTPPLSEQAHDSPAGIEPPPPPQDRQFSASQLPIIPPEEKSRETDNDSTKVLAPPSRAGGIETPREAVQSPGAGSLNVPGSFTQDPRPETAAAEGVPGAFPNVEDTPVASRSQTPAAAKDDFDSAFDGFGDSHQSKDAEQDDPFAVSSNATARGSEFPPIRTLEHDYSESDSSDDEDSRGFDDDFTAASPPRAQAPASHERSIGEDPSTAAAALSAVSLSQPSSSTPLPGAEAQRSPPAYDDSNKISHGGSGQRTEETDFPPEFDGLLPSREDPTSPPPPTGPSPVVASTTEIAPESGKQTPLQTPPATSSGIHPFPTAAASSSVPPQAAAPKGAFDDFDEFDDLAEAKEADKTGSDLDFGFKGADDEFSPNFDSPAASMTTTMASSQQTPVAANRSLHTEATGANGFGGYQSSGPAFGSAANADDTSSIQQSSQNGQHDWDAIFSGLDNSKQIDTSLNASDPWGESTSNGFGGALSSSTAMQAPATEPTSKPSFAPGSLSAPAPKSVPDRGGALTPGTEHDDPILKRLTGMGYQRTQALAALEEFDYDINRAVDHLTSQ